MEFEFSFSQLLLIVVYFKYVKLVPNEYCLSPLNTRDCGIPPTPVFYYYKYGSRCEIDYWRGCPTENKFENEYHCSHYCIGKTKYSGRERGSWKGRVLISIEVLSLNELEEINRILHKIYDSVTSSLPNPLPSSAGVGSPCTSAIKHPEPRHTSPLSNHPKTINTSPGSRLKIPLKKTTVNGAEKDENNRREENDEIDEGPDDIDDSVEYSKRILTATQMPITENPKRSDTGDILLRGN